MIKGYIYKTTNLINSKIYVGQYTGSWKQYLGSGKYLQNAIKKYGENNFKNEIIETCTSRELLNEREAFWIRELNSKVPIGYNIAEGSYGGYISEEHCKRASETSKRKWKEKSIEDKNRTIKNLSKMWGWSKGISKSEEIRKKISDSLRGRKQSEETKQKRKNSNKKTLEPRGEEIGQKISRALKGIKRTDEFKEKLRKANSLPIIQKDMDDNFIKRWGSGGEVMKAFNYKYSAKLRRACIGEIDSFLSYKWCFEKDYEERTN